MHYVYILFCILQFVVSAALIGVVLIQEPKNEGLTGQIGSSATSSFKGKAGREDQLSDLTRKVAIAFFVISLCVAVGTGRW